MINTMKNSWLRLAATLTVLVLSTDDAHAQSGQTVGSMANKVKESLDNIPAVIAIISYIAGTALGIAGILKLKQHADNPSSVKMQDGMMRLAAAAGLIALPWLIDTVLGTAGGSKEGSLNRFSL